MNYYGDPVTNLIEELRKLPGIGGKLAQRLAFYIINMPEEKVYRLSDVIRYAKDNIKYCSICCNLSDSDPCPICSNEKPSRYKAAGFFNGQWTIMKWGNLKLPHEKNDPVHAVTEKDHFLSGIYSATSSSRHWRISHSRFKVWVDTG